MKLISAICLFGFTLFVSGIANAGDYAKRHIHGFSINGGLFAFEEFGVHDGSGFPYSNIYVIDTATDQQTAGSPFRAQLSDETKTIFDAREEARILAGPVMKSFEDRGNIVATNQPTEKGIDTGRIVANPRLVVPPIDEDIEFRLDNLSFLASADCEAFGQSAGYRLTRIATGNGDTTSTIREDSSVPASRNCPLGYKFADVVTYFPDGAAPVVAVLILMEKVGFEGPDGRYLAVTSQLQ